MRSTQITNALTVDVEDYFHVSAFAATIAREDWDTYESRIERNTHKLLDIFHEREQQGTFFVLGWVAERYPHLVRDIAAQGHEVACHGLTHRLVYDQSPSQFRQETLRARSVLEDLIQQAVVGYRAASYSITAQSIWALDILVELEFVYDSSIFPIHHDRYGMPGAYREPHRLQTPLGHSIVEFPLSTIEVLSYRLPVSGGGYFRLLPYVATRAALRSINRRECRPFIFYLHPWEIDPGQPRIASDWFSQFRHYNNLDKCEDRLRRLLNDFELGTAKETLKNLNLLDHTS